LKSFSYSIIFITKTTRMWCSRHAEGCTLANILRKGSITGSAKVLHQFCFSYNSAMQCHRDLMFFLLKRAKCLVQKCIKEFDCKCFSKATKVLEQKALKTIPQLWSYFLYLTIMIWAISLLTFDAFEYYLYTVVRYNEGFYLVWE
jgi:hypothetical protein